MAVTVPAAEVRNLTPSSTASVSLSDGRAGVAVVGQRLHGQLTAASAVAAASGLVDGASPPTARITRAASMARSSRSAIFDMGDLPLLTSVIGDSNVARSAIGRGSGVF